MDPLDGTVNYSRGLPHFAVPVTVGGIVRAGSVRVPAAGDSYNAVLGRGAPERPPALWDIAAAGLIAREAGAVVGHVAARGTPDFAADRSVEPRWRRGCRR